MAAPAAKRARTSWDIKIGERANNVENPIRKIMDSIAGKENPEKRLISLAQGDPTAYPHLRPGEPMVNAVVDMLHSGTCNGYQPSQGNGSARTALAKYYSVEGMEPLKPTDVFMTLGCSEALAHCIGALAATGGNLLLPRPGFCLYQVLCQYHGVEPRYYDLLPDQGWEIDLEQLATLADENTIGLLINNPSNPCGAVYSKAHLTKVMEICAKSKVPVIADEVYSAMTFGETYHPCASVTKDVPVMSVCAVSKRWLAPGWRLGWVTVHDAHGLLTKAGVQEALLKLCQVSLGPSAPLQMALPAILENTPKEWYEQVMCALKASADTCVRRCRVIHGFEITSEPVGAMYFMVRLKKGAYKGMNDDVEFAGKLLAEESIAVLPGACFNAPGMFRVVFAAPPDVLEDAFDRIEAFCKRHAA